MLQGCMIKNSQTAEVFYLLSCPVSVWDYTGQVYIFLKVTPYYTVRNKYINMYMYIKNRVLI